MANKNPENPTENVRLGEEPTPFTVPAGQPTKKEAHEKVRVTLSNIIGRLKGLLDEFPRVPGDEVLDNALSAANFSRAHLQQACDMLKE